MLEAIALSKSFNGRVVVDQVSLKGNPGEVVALLGANGAGKTTTFQMLIGLIKADSGKIMLNGVSIRPLPMYRRAKLGIIYLPQETSVFKKLTVEENILLILESQKLSSIERKTRLHDLLKELNIAHLAENKAYSLSGGERRRLEITRALALSPRFILLDEPFAGIDPITINDTQNIICRLKANGIGVVITDHNVRDALQVCDRAYIMNNGKILETGSPKKIVNSQEVRRLYLGEDFTWELPGCPSHQSSRE